MNYKQEIMSDEFSKHLFDFEGKEPFHFVVHHFTGRDKGHPHDHPYSMTSHILKGSYIERRYFILRDGKWATEDRLRKKGDSFRIEADTIHEIIELPDGEVWTACVPEVKVHEPGFWHFDSAIWYRQWNEPDFKLYK